jgi:hypothetical protein
MDILLMIFVLVCSLIPISIAPIRIGKALFGFVVLFVGIMVQIGGVTLTSLVSNNTTYTIVQTNTTFSFVIFLFMTFGAILSIYAVMAGGNEDDEG